MNKEHFSPGQRWVSNTEADLGLGVVSAVEGRRVTVNFPASGETRTYARDNAPLSRIEYAVGDTLTTAGGESLEVVARASSDGRLIYTAADDAGAAREVDELELDSFVSFSSPEERLLAGQIDRSKLFELRAQTLAHRHRWRSSGACGLIGPRVQLLPHQLYIAARVARRHAPRVLLADEVGLGKTIESGLVIHHNLLTGHAERVLIAVPDSLVHQWLVEMLRRFNLRFTILDEERCAALSDSGTDNPFESAQLVLCALSFVVRNAERLEQAAAAPFDLLVVDEAHHLEWRAGAPSPEYAAVEALSASAGGVLLLTGTPEQLGIEGHFARLRLLDPERYPDLDAFLESEAGYAPVGTLVRGLTNAVTETDVAALLPALERYLGAGAARELASAAGTQAYADAAAACVDRLLDRHGTGRVLFRNTRDALGGFPGRRLEMHALRPPEPFEGASASAGVPASLRPESLLGEGWLMIDPRVEWLADWLGQHRDRKVLLICATADTAIDLEQHLRLRCGVRSAAFHEGLTLVARDRAAAYFADADESAQILVCSEIGSEGRNFQFASDLVLFDLPLNPDLLEQRIGRLDRIGQQQEIRIHVPYYEGSAQSVLLRWYHEGINAIERSCPAAERLAHRFEAPLHAACAKPHDGAAIGTLLADSRKEAAEVARIQEAGRDRLLELNSCRPARAERVIQAIVDASRGVALERYMEQVFDRFGVQHETHSASAVVLRPGDHMLVPSFPGLPEDGMTGTFSRTKALSREDMQFLTWEHPLVTGAMDLIIGGEYGNTALFSFELPPLKPGAILAECYFVLVCPAPRALRMERFVPEAALRVVVDDRGRDLGRVLTDERMSQIARKVPIDVARQLVRRAGPALKSMIAQARSLADANRDGIVDGATTRMRAHEEAERERLAELAKVNPAIRPEEIERQAAAADALATHLDKAHFELDCVRLGFAA